MHCATNARLYTKCRGAVQRMSGSILNIIFTYISFNFSIQMAQHNICLALITLSSVLHGTAQPLSGLICIIMEIAHSFSSIHQISCQFIAFLCKDQRPAYLLMRQGTASCALRFIIKEQCPAPFLSHSHYQGVMSCSISNSSQQLPGFVIRDISMSDPATELIPSPSDPKLLFAIVPIILLGLTIMPLIWLHFIKCRYPGVGSQFSIIVQLTPKGCRSSSI
jgi:hypothetical protein